MQYIRKNEVQNTSYTFIIILHKIICSTPESEFQHISKIHSISFKGSSSPHVNLNMLTRYPTTQGSYFVLSSWERLDSIHTEP